MFMTVFLFQSTAHCSGVLLRGSRGKISAMEQQLPPYAFARIHRSIIVNLDRIKELQPLFYGDYAVVLTDGTRLTLSRSYRPKVLDLLTSVCSA